MWDIIQNNCISVRIISILYETKKEQIVYRKVR